MMAVEPTMNKREATARRFNKALLDYASYGNVVGVKAMLSGGIDIQTKNEEGNTALHLASKYNYMELVKVLLESGAQPCNQNQLSKIPAEMTTDGEIKALLNGYLLKYVKDANGYGLNVLLKRGVSIETTNSENDTSLHIAAKAGHAGIVDWLLLDGAKAYALNSDLKLPRNLATDERIKKSLDMSILRYVREGNDEGVSILLENGVSTEIKDWNGNTSLHLACERNSFGIVQPLLSKGALTFAFNNASKLPRDLATTEEIIELLDNAILDYVRNGLEEAVGILLDDGVSTEIKDEKGNTLLHLAAERNNMLIVQNLLPRKAQSFALNNELKLPRDLTSDQAIIRVLDLTILGYMKDGNRNAVIVMLQHGTPTDLEDDNRNTLLHLATQRDYIEMVKEILSKGAKSYLKNAKLELPRDLTKNDDIIKLLDASIVSYAGEGNEEAVDMLLQNGVSVDTVDENGNTSLHLASKGNYALLVQKFISKGAKTYLKNAKLELPRDLTKNDDIIKLLDASIVSYAGEGNEEVVDMLLQNGVSVDTVDENGNTSLHLASKGNYALLVQKLLQLFSAKTYLKNAKLELPRDLTKNDDIIRLLDASIVSYAGEGNEEAVDVLIQNGVSVDTVDENGNTSLHLASKGNYALLVQKLLLKGAQSSALNIDSEFPVDLTTDEEVVKLLNMKFVHRVPMLGYSVKYGDLITHSTYLRAMRRCTHEIMKGNIIAGSVPLAPFEGSNAASIWADMYSEATGEVAGIAIRAAISNSTTESERMFINDEWEEDLTCTFCIEMGIGAVDTIARGIGTIVHGAYPAIPDDLEALDKKIGAPFIKVPPSAWARSGFNDDAESSKLQRSSLQRVVGIVENGAKAPRLTAHQPFTYVAKISSNFMKDIRERNDMSIRREVLKTKGDMTTFLINQLGPVGDTIDPPASSDSFSQIRPFSAHVQGCISRKGIPAVLGHMHVATAEVEVGDERDATSSFAYVTHSPTQMSTLFIENSKTLNGFHIRVSGSSGETSEDRYLSVANEHPKDTQGKNALLVHAADVSKNTPAIWALEIYDDAYPVLKLINAGDSSGSSVNGGYLVAEFNNTVRLDGGAYLSVRSDQPTSDDSLSIFGFRFVRQDQLWWVDVVGDYEYNGPASKNNWHYVTISESIDHQGLYWMNRAGYFWGLTPKSGSRDTLVKHMTTTYPEMTQVKVVYDSSKNISGVQFGNDLYDRLWWRDLEGMIFECADLSLRLSIKRLIIRRYGGLDRDRMLLKDKDTGSIEMILKGNYKNREVLDSDGSSPRPGQVQVRWNSPPETVIGLTLDSINYVRWNLNDLVGTYVSLAYDKNRKRVVSKYASIHRSFKGEEELWWQSSNGETWSLQYSSRNTLVVGPTCLYFEKKCFIYRNALGEVDTIVGPSNMVYTSLSPVVDQSPLEDNVKGDENGNFPLHLAAIRGHFRIVERLLSQGSMTYAKNNKSKLPRDLVSDKGILQILDASLVSYAGEGNEEAVDVLLQNGVSVDTVDENGNTSLHLASKGDHVLLVQKFISKGAKTYLKNAKLELPRDLTKNDDIIRLLDASIVSVKWRLLSNNLVHVKNGIWDVQDIFFFDPLGSKLLVSPENSFDSGHYPAAYWFPERAFMGNGGAWGGRRSASGEMYIGMDFKVPVRVNSIQFTNRSDNSARGVKVQCLYKEMWITLAEENGLEVKAGYVCTVPIQSSNALYKMFPLHQIDPRKADNLDYNSSTRHTAPSEYGVIEHRPIGDVYEGILMRLTKDSRAQPSNVWVDMVLPIDLSIGHEPVRIRFEFKMSELRSNGAYCSLFFKRVDGGNPGHLEIKFDLSKLRVYGESIIQGSDANCPNVQAGKWIDLEVIFDWKHSLVDVAVQDTTRKTYSLQTNKGVCAYNGIHSILLRGYNSDPAKEHLQAWRKIELYPEFYPSP